MSIPVLVAVESEQLVESSCVVPPRDAPAGDGSRDVGVCFRAVVAGEPGLEPLLLAFALAAVLGLFPRARVFLLFLVVCSLLFHPIPLRTAPSF